MQTSITRILLWLIALVILLLTANVAWAQEDTTPKTRLRSPATVKGFIGGESHAGYVIRARKGQTMTVQISWKRKAGNRAEFTVSESANFYSAAEVAFGKMAINGRLWRGKVPQTGTYYVYVVAHPTANYRLSVTVE